MLYSHYSINVARNGVHYFATSPHSGMSWSKGTADAMLKELKARFPAEEGFSVELTHVEVTGRKLA